MFEMRSVALENAKSFRHFMVVRIVWKQLGWKELSWNSSQLMTLSNG